MGEVYEGVQLNLDRRIALKFLHADFQRADSEFARRFVLEAATASRLSHPNVVTVHDYGETEHGDLYMAMEYIDGLTLAEVIANEGALRLERVLGIAIQITRGLREAHSKGVIHRDLKAGNVMLIRADDDTDLAKILDFGLVKLNARPETQSFGTSTGQDLTRAGALLGSPIYMSPEQIRGDDIGPGSDIYALGVLMFEMATGKPPFHGATSVDTVYAHLNHAPPSFAEIAPDDAVYPELEAVVMRCLAKDAGERFGSMAELTEVLKTVARRLTDDSFNSGRVHVASALAATGEWAPVSPAALAASLEPVLSEHSAALQDPGLRDDETVGTPRPSRGALEPPSRLPLVIAVVSALVGALVVAIMLRPDAPAPPPVPAPLVKKPAPPPPPTVAQVRFESTPAGAQVTEGGRTLGTTPFSVRLPIGDEARTFDFTRDGYDPSRVIAPVASESLTLTADLVARPAPEPTVEAKPKPKPRPKRVKRRRRPKPKPKAKPASDKPRNVPAYIRDNPY